MNFNIIEGEPEDYWDDYEEFIELYNANELRVTEIRDKLQLSQNKYRRYREHAFKENRLEFDKRNPNIRKQRGRRPMKKLHPKYYYKEGKQYYVRKRVNGEFVYYGAYASQGIAEEVVKKLKECNWNKKELSRIQKELGV